jgi:hypothetical protein
MKKLLSVLAVVGVLAAFHVVFQTASVWSRGASTNFTYSDGGSGQACNNNDSPNGGDE